jgi:hypothetical protein
MDTYHDQEAFLVSGHHKNTPQVVRGEEKVAGSGAPHRVFSSKMKGGRVGSYEATRLTVPQIERSSSTRRRGESNVPLKSPPSYSLPQEQQPPRTTSKSSSSLYYEPRRSAAPPDHESTARPSWQSPPSYSLLQEQPPRTASKSSLLYYEPRRSAPPDHESSTTNTRPSWPPKQYGHYQEHRSTALDDFSYDDEFVQQQAAILKQIADDKKKKQAQVTTGGSLYHDAPRASSATTSPMKASEPLASIDNNDDFCRYLQDSEMIKEQRMILERIQREQQAQQEAQQPSAARSVEDLTSRIHESADGLINTSPRRGSDMSSSSSTEKIRPCEAGSVPSRENDIVTKIGKQRLRIKGTSHTYTAIANGSATLVQCMSCKAILQVGASAKLLYCTNCQQVTPIEVARYNHSAQPSVDQQIARTVQQQELDVACARKLSKIARSRDDR